MLFCCCVNADSDNAEDTYKPRVSVNDSDAAETVYVAVLTKNAEGQILSEDIEGELTESIREGVARPWHAIKDGLLYDDVAWHQELDDGSSVQGYAIEVSATEPTPSLELATTPPSDDLLAAVATAGGGSIDVMVRLAIAPPAPLPLLTGLDSLDEATQQAKRDEFETLAASGAATFAAQSAEFVDAVGAADGTVNRTFWSIGWLSVTVPADAVEALSQRADVRAIEPMGIGEDGCNLTQSTLQPGGDGVSLGDLRGHTGVDDFHASGFHGQPSAGPLLIGIHESSAPEDDACFWDDYGNCNPDDRLKRFECASGSCNYVTDFPDVDEGDHGTRVASIVLADYNQGQGSAHEASIAPGLPAGWRDHATSFGKEAEAHYYAVGGAEAAKVAGFQCGRNLGPGECQTMDIVSSSNSILFGTCNSTSQLAIEAEVEQLWDAGVLAVANTHNENNYYDTGSGSFDSCKVRSPADIPKAFAVGALEPDETKPYSNWRYAGYSNRGGGPVISSGLYYSEAQTMVDLVASGNPGHLTVNTSVHSYGVVEAGPICVGTFSGAGTSFAAPQVASASALVKHRMINNGHAWIENPGRLHTMMLSMGDRATNVDRGARPPTIPSCVSGDRLRCGGDKYYGFGRLKLRQHNSYFMRTKTFGTSTPEHKEWIWGGPIGSNRAILKCVMQQGENMANQTEISRINLRITLLDPNPANGKCEHWDPSIIAPPSRVDSSADDKHMVAFEDSDTNINGKCVELTLTPQSISPTGSITTHTYCYVDDQLDY